MSLVELSTLAALVFGVIGTVLGVLNAMHQIADRRVRIRLVPRLAFQTETGFFSFKPPLQREVHPSLAPFPAFEIINNSKFPIVIDQVGYCTRGGQRGKRAFLCEVYTVTKERLPIKIEPRRSVTLYAGHYAFAQIEPQFTYAYASTDCDAWSKKTRARRSPFGDNTPRRIS